MELAVQVNNKFAYEIIIKRMKYTEMFQFLCLTSFYKSAVHPNIFFLQTLL